jgi:RND family efflux transporter MFP subunit
MRISTKAQALLVTAVALVGGTLAVGQDAKRVRPSRGGSASADGTLLVPGTLEWLVRSDLSAKREGVIERMLLDDGELVEKGKEIGRLDDDIARLTVEKQELIARSLAAIKKATAQREQANAALARFKRLRIQNQGFASQDEMDKATADVNFADALLLEAKDKQLADIKDMELAKKALEQHEISAPFNGVIIKRYKHPGEAVQANEPVVRIGNTDKFKFVGWVTLENSQRIRPGDAVEFRAVVEGSDLPLEERVFEGKVLGIGSEIPQVGNPEISITAEIVNPIDPEHPEHSLLQGLRGELTILSKTKAAARTANRPAANPAVLDPSVSTTARQR